MTQNKIKSLLLITLSHLFTSSVIKAQETQNVQLEKIQVLEHSDSESLIDFIPSITQLKGDELRKKRQATLGETLQNEAGVNSSNFGPNASRPVIRGQDGPRIRVLQNGLSTMDASIQSADHNVPVDPMIIDQVEIVRGPMSLLYGSSAVGGVVNIVTNRIHNHFSEGLLTEVQSQAESVNNGISNSARIDFGKNEWMIHLDGATRNLQNQKIPGYARTEEERATPLDEGQEPHKELLNSENKLNNIGAGATKFFSKGHLGVSYNFFQNDYGAIKEQFVDINMQQNRLEINGEYKPNSVFSKVKLKSALTDYRHKEIEEGNVGTIFKNRGNETRVEFLNKKDAWSGVSGLQSEINNFSAQGDEAFLPESQNNIYSMFTFQEYVFDQHVVSAGARAESTNIHKKESSNFTGDETFDMSNYSGSFGYLYKINGHHSISTAYSYTERAPNAQELFANGAHVATGIFERGSNALNEETAHALEISFKRETQDHYFMLSLHTQYFNDYIYLSPTGTNDTDSGLEIYDFLQNNALFYGIDLEGKQSLAKTDKGDFHLKETFDFVRAKNTTTSNNLPRISPARIGLAFEYSKDKWSADVDWRYAFSQTKTAPDETTTEDYLLTSIGGQYSTELSNTKLDIFLRVRNIFDVEARNHVSTLKDEAPLAGRNFIVGLQWLL